MQTSLADFIRDTPEGREADTILRTCVHCGFCNATCPTYQLLGDELDGPRGRIYLMKRMFETGEASAKTRLHLDRCLTCRSCESTCPSGVQYMHLIDIGRNAMLERAGRPLAERFVRRALAEILPRRWLFAPLVALGRLARPLLPRALAEKVPAAPPAALDWPLPRQSRRMLTIAGCVQPTLSPEINAATARVLARLGISLVEVTGAGCCGALRTHLDFQEQGREDMRRVIDACWPLVEQGAEAIVVTASGCGSTMKDYGHALAHDQDYALKAKRIAAMTRDPSEVIAAELPQIEALVAGSPGKTRRAAFHPPCSLQHGQKITGVTERILAAAGFDLTVIPDSHLCCGSAGTYSILQPALAEQLKRNKLAAITSGQPEQILTANIGCQTHLAEGTKLPVRHWIVALEERLR